MNNTLKPTGGPTRCNFALYIMMLSPAAHRGWTAPQQWSHLYQAGT